MRGPGGAAGPDVVCGVGGGEKVAEWGVGIATFRAEEEKGVTLEGDVVHLEDCEGGEVGGVEEEEAVIGVGEHEDEIGRDGGIGGWPEDLGGAIGGELELVAGVEGLGGAVGGMEGVFNFGGGEGPVLGVESWDKHGVRGETRDAFAGVSGVDGVDGGEEEAIKTAKTGGFEGGENGGSSDIGLITGAGVEQIGLVVGSGKDNGGALADAEDLEVEID